MKYEGKREKGFTFAGLLQVALNAFSVNHLPQAVKPNNLVTRSGFQFQPTCDYSSDWSQSIASIATNGFTSLIDIRNTFLEFFNPVNLPSENVVAFDVCAVELHGSDEVDRISGGPT